MTFLGKTFAFWYAQEEALLPRLLCLEKENVFMKERISSAEI